MYPFEYQFDAYGGTINNFKWSTMQSLNIYYLFHWHLNFMLSFSFKNAFCWEKNFNKSSFLQKSFCIECNWSMLQNATAASLSERLSLTGSLGAPWISGPIHNSTAPSGTSSPLFCFNLRAHCQRSQGCTANQRPRIRRHSAQQPGPLSAINKG